jgi:DNA-binding NarL/FixJ family response regulator
MACKIKVVVVDDHVGFRTTLAQVLERSGAIQVAGMGANAGEAVRLALELTPDVLLLDINMPGDGLAAAQAVAAAKPEIMVMMLTASREAQHVAQAIRAGARAYVLKGLSGRELIGIIRAVYEGKTYLSPVLAQSVPTDLTSNPFGTPSQVMRGNA